MGEEEPTNIAPATDTRKTGTVKWFSPTKGFGFIVPEQAGPDVFVHLKAVERSGLVTLKEGDKVSYELIPTRQPGKLEAISLERIG